MDGDTARAALRRTSGAYHSTALALSELADARIEAASGNATMAQLKQRAAHRLLAAALAAIGDDSESA